MEKLGKVLEVYIPGEDVMNSKLIGFKVQTEDEIITIEEEQDEFNANIYKEDIVLVNKALINGKEILSIELVGE